MDSLVREWKAHESGFQICIKLEDVKLELEKAVTTKPFLSMGIVEDEDWNLGFGVNRVEWMR